MEKPTYESPTRLGYEILRDHVLPTILGQHEDDILYWSGKDVARKFPIFETDELPSFFTEAGWGQLTLEKEDKDEMQFVLGPIERLVIENRSYQLEAGFIAEQLQKLNGFLTECYGQKEIQHDRVRFIAKWDVKTIVEN
ncbi:DUF2507 domain-containing protein [Sporosarcina cyprini]|uniref:DUF2507 domain-containing protein n=1 Tax=Sporosarcina cyprini TaxID=2910523 RepID=UPI001EDF3599|nr:YslB family protein [Sporosarcina cyprini]